MTDVMCCARCGHALKIICPEHGAEFVPDRRMEPLPASPVVLPKAPPRKAQPLRDGSNRARMRAALTSEPQHYTTIANVCGLDASLVGIELASMSKKGHAQRVGRGFYAKAA